MPKKRKESAEGGDGNNTNGKSHGAVEESPQALYQEQESLHVDVTPPAAPNVTAELEYVSPAQAAAWLATFAYDRQRDRYAPHVKDLANALVHGQYSLQGIILCEIEGVWRLTDGQHRLQAIVDSGIGAYEVVIRKWGLTAETGADEYSRTDRGKRRQVADALRAHNAGAAVGLSSNQVNLISGAVGIILPGFGYTKPGIRTRLQMNSTDVMVHEVERWLNAGTRYFKTVAGYQRGRYKHLALAATVAVGLVTCEYAWEKAEEFWHRAAHDDYNALDDWLKVLLLDLFAEKKAERSRPPLFARYVAQVWNAYYEDRPLTRLRAPDMTEPITIAGTPYRGRQTSSMVNPQVAS